jgi:serine/threonine protein kinase
VVKVLDFGVAKVLGRADAVTTTPGGLLGSPGYMSPEQAQTRGDVDGRADIWALGVVLFEMLVGNRPFQGRMTNILMGILTQPIPRISVFQPDIDPNLDEIVAGCMERNRDARIASATILAERLQPFVREEEGSRALMVLASRAILSAAQLQTERSPDSVATRVPSSSENILPQSSKKGFDLTLQLPIDGLPGISAKGTVLLVDKPSPVVGVGAGPRGTMRMIESSKLSEQVAEARREIEIKLARQTPPPPEPMKAPQAPIGTATIVPASKKRGIPVLLVVGLIALVVIVGVALAIVMRGASSNDPPNSGAEKP